MAPEADRTRDEVLRLAMKRAESWNRLQEAGFPVPPASRREAEQALRGSGLRIIQIKGRYFAQEVGLPVECELSLARPSPATGPPKATTASRPVRVVVTTKPGPEEAGALDEDRRWQVLDGRRLAHCYAVYFDILQRMGLPLSATDRKEAARALHGTGWTVKRVNGWHEARSVRAGLSLSTTEEEGHWVTIGGVKDEETGKRRGGSPVFIKGGRIVKGAPRLVGRHLGNMKAEAEEGGHRRQLRQGKEYATARLVKEARAEGIKSKDLHALAGDILAHDRAHVQERTKALQLARRTAASLHTSLQTLKARAAHGIDADSVRHLDDIAASVASSYPEQFAGHEDLGERLFSMLAEGNPKAMSEAAAYEQALEHLRERQASEPWDSPLPWEDDDDNPFR